MNHTVKIYSITFFLLTSVFFLASCKKPTIPKVITSAVSRIEQRSAYSGGQVTSDGDAQVYELGVCWNTSPDPEPDITNNKTSDSTSTGIFISHITGLTANTKYYLRAYATNIEGTGYGETVSFTTDEAAIPTVTTLPLKSVTLTTAAGGGDISNDGGLEATSRGVCWNTTGSPEIVDNHSSDGGGAGLFSSTLTDLSLGTTYHVRAFATNSLGTGYGNELEFTLVEPITDNDGNAYRSVTIGTQVWLAENLRTTTFNDGVAIPYISDGTQWAVTSTPAFCWYNNSELEFKNTYGALYNWYAVNTGILCPTGWHVPTVEEYTALLVYLGGDQVAGGKLKEAGTNHWVSPNLGATNGSDFSGLPGGGRYNYYSQGGTFSDLGYFGYLWSATASSTASNAFSYDLSYAMSSVNKGDYSKSDGGSVRCIKNSR